MNVIINGKNINYGFISNVNGFDINNPNTDDQFIVFYNGNRYGWGIAFSYIVEMMYKYIPVLNETETNFKYIKRNIEYFNTIKEKIFNALMVAYKNDEDIYIIQEIKNIMKEYFETQGQ